MNQSINIDKDKIFELTLKLCDAPDTSVLANVLEKRKKDLEKTIKNGEEGEKLKENINALKNSIL